MNEINRIYFEKELYHLLTYEYLENELNILHDKYMTISCGTKESIFITIKINKIKKHLNKINKIII
jgi:hypothetical protein